MTKRVIGNASIPARVFFRQMFDRQLCTVHGRIVHNRLCQTWCRKSPPIRSTNTATVRLHRLAENLSAHHRIRSGSTRFLASDPACHGRRVCVHFTEKSDRHTGRDWKSKIRCSADGKWWFVCGKQKKKIKIQFWPRQNSGDFELWTILLTQNIEFDGRHRLHVRPVQMFGLAYNVTSVHFFGHIERQHWFDFVNLNFNVKRNKGMIIWCRIAFSQRFVSYLFGDGFHVKLSSIG